MASSPRWIGSSVRAYEMLLKAYPATFRRRFADEMAWVFQEHLEEAWRRRGVLGLVETWFRVLGDLARSAPCEHLDELRRSMAMKDALRAVASVAIAAVTYLVVYASLGFLVAIPLAIENSVLVQQWMFLVVLYFGAFLTGLILTRTQPFFRPRLTAPLAMLSIWGPAAAFDGVAHGHWLARVGFVATVALAALLGSVVASKASSRLGRISVPWFPLAASVGILVSTASVYFILRVALLNNQLSADFRSSVVACIAVLGTIALVTIANLVFLVVRENRRPMAAGKATPNP